MTVLTDGAVVDQLAYDGFGRLTYESNPSAGDRFSYTGRERDPVTSLQYNRGRYYDTLIGSWTEQDPTGIAAGDSNFNRYAGNDPVNNSDPSGLSWTAMNGVGNSFGPPQEADAGDEPGLMAYLWGIGQKAGNILEPIALVADTLNNPAKFLDALPYIAQTLESGEAFDSLQGAAQGAWNHSGAPLLGAATWGLNNTLGKLVNYQGTTDFTADSAALYGHQDALQAAVPVGDGLGYAADVIMLLGGKVPAVGGLGGGAAALSGSGGTLVGALSLSASGTRPLAVAIAGAANLGYNLSAPPANMVDAQGPPGDPTPVPVHEAGNAVRRFLGDGFVVKRNDAKGFVAMSQDGKRIFRMDIQGHGDSPHAHIEIFDEARRRFVDAGPVHRYYFKGE